MEPRSDFEVHPTGAITVTLRPRYDIISEWPPAREDLGLNAASSEPIDGVELVEEAELRRGKYEKVVLQFENFRALSKAKDRLYDAGDERAEYGMYREAEDVHDFASALPTAFDIEQCQSSID